MSKSQSSGPLSEAGLVQYYDATSDEMIFLNPRTVLAFTAALIPLLMGIHAVL